VIGLPPSSAGADQLTHAERVSASAEAAVGADGAPAPSGVTALDGADTAPAPLGFVARTVNVYAVPGVRPLTVVLVSGGVPVTVFGVWAAPPMCGVTVYEVAGPPLAGAVQETDAAPCCAVAWTFVTWPGAPAGAYSTSTQ
jgi:hypothetical protein